MRVLVVSNLYPPKILGGYELGCQQIVRGLRDLGHHVKVLTSTFGGVVSGSTDNATRALSFEPVSDGRSRLVHYLRRELKDNLVVRHAVVNFDPEIILVFSLFGVPHSIMRTLERTGRTVAYAFSAEWLDADFQVDPWLGFWRRRASTRLKRLGKRVLEAPVSMLTWTGSRSLDLKVCFFTSRRLRDLFLKRGLRVERGCVIRWGVDAETFRPGHSRGLGGETRLLFAGRLVPEKGFHTVVEAMRILVDEHGPHSLRCTVAGPSSDPGYLKQNRRNIDLWGLDNSFHFVGEVPPERMPEIYREHDGFLLPSIWEEPFSIGLVEAMASGLVALATPTGGTPEILRDGENGMLFEPESAADLAAKMWRLYKDDDLMQRLSAAARETVVETFTIERMVADVEIFLDNAREMGQSS